MRIQITAGGSSMALVGRALSPEAVPQFIEELAPEPAYVGREFQTLLLQVPETGPPVIDFALSTEREQGEGGTSLLQAFLEEISGGAP